MHAHTQGENLLYDLAKTLAVGNDHATAIALRKLVHAGYTTLQQVDGVPDWILLSLPGIGVKRLGAVRRLTRSDWQPPSRHAVQVTRWYLSAVRLALSFWPPDTLASVVWGTALAIQATQPLEARLALDVFIRAAREAQRYCLTQDLIDMLELAKNDLHLGCAGRDPGLHHDSGVQIEVMPSGQPERPGPETFRAEPRPVDTATDSDHYAFTHRERREIVQHYRAARARGQVTNKDSWARANYSISGRTLRRYEIEYSETVWAGWP